MNGKNMHFWETVKAQTKEEIICQFEFASNTLPTVPISNMENEFGEMKTYYYL